MRILVYGTHVNTDHLKYIRELLDSVESEGIGVAIYEPFKKELDNYFPVSDKLQPFHDHEDFDKQKIDFVITLGGDGTILRAITLIREREIPILGINMGRLGFLATIENKHAARAIHHLARGMYTIEDRTMIYLETDEKIFQGERFALNDFTIHKRDTSSMITIRVYVNGDFLTTYWADGLIVSTPTGSTGYSLSCGGPIVFPNSGNFVLTAVAPHNLNVRPLVISDESVISFEIDGRSANFLCTLDSRFETVNSDIQLAVRKCDFATRLVVPYSFSFFRTIHEKLTWGADTRN